MKKLLVVDDSLFMRMIIKNALKGTEIEVIEANDGLKALELFRINKPDLVTMDIAMPEKTGIEVLSELLRENPRAKVIMCSSMVNERTDAEVKELGATSFIKKPFKDKEFRDCVLKHISD